MSYNVPKLKGDPSRELLVESSDEAVLLDFFSIWVQMMKI